MKKLELYKLVKQSLKEVLQEPKPTKKEGPLPMSPMEKLKWTQNPLIKEHFKSRKKKQKLIKEQQTGGSGMSLTCQGYTTYGNLELFTGNCGNGGQNITSEQIDDEFFCCSSRISS